MTTSIGSCDTAVMTNIFSPSGGVINPAFIISTAITPNQIGSKPNASTVGKITGKVSTIIAATSRKQPRII